MDAGIIKIGILIAVITLLIYLIKNFNTILNLYNSNKENKKIKFLIKLIGILIIIILLCVIIKYAKLTIKNLKWYMFSIENEKINEIYDEKIIEENEFYANAINREYLNQTYNKPYIPDGFSYVKGEWDTGFVIQDNFENQYVWVPCTNEKKSEIPLLSRKNFTETSWISKDMCNNEKYMEFINSSLENGGFYISRFEIGKENGNPVSKKGAEVWTELNKKEVYEIIKKLKYNNINCELINGYAYDTTLEWIMKNNEVELINNDIDQPIISGKKSYNNIYDIFDNTMELTSEINYGTIIVRGVFLKNENLNSSINNLDRVSIFENDNYFSEGTKLGFRTIIYK